MDYDYLIVGAGFAGLVMAERLTSQLGAKVLLVEKRSHIGGNSQDEYDANGVLIHKYGPHYFRTNSEQVKDYLSQFTDWHPVDYQILSHTDGRYWNFPINLNTYEQLIGRSATSEEFQTYLEKKRIPIAFPKNSEEVVISQVGWELYEKFFKGYTLKQWKRSPKELDASVCGRIPIRTDRNDLYLREAFQALPKNGYHHLFNQMVKASPSLEIHLETDYRNLPSGVTYQHLIYTGPIDLFYNYEYGKLPYRSLRFENEFFSTEQLIARESIAKKSGFYQPAMQVNYPNDYDFTRIVEMKHATRQDIAGSTIVHEFPEDYQVGKEPFYPIPNPQSQALYERYEHRAEQEKNITFLGRLATYRYYNMDQIVALALKTFSQLEKSPS